MKRIVLKIGSAVLSEQNRLAKERIDSLVAFVCELSEQYEVMIVSSGAVAAGYTEMKLDKKDIANKQALAAIGQPLLMKYYFKRFSSYGKLVAQVLLTADDFDSRKRTDYAKSAIERLLEQKVVPVINENDVTATEELIFGDNDRLSAHVCHYFDADMLVILTDVDGYYDSNPKENPDAKLLPKVDTISEEAMSVEANPNSEFATGGIKTKLQAAHFLLQHGKKMFLTSGFELSYARSYLMEGKYVKGTLFSKD